MDYIYVFTGGFVILIVIFRRELLTEIKSYRIILGISTVLFLVGVLLHYTPVGRYYASGALLSPLLTLGLFRLFRKIFLNRFKHEPRDTFLDWETGLAADRLFNFFYFMSAFLLLMFAAIGMEELAKAGW